MDIALCHLRRSYELTFVAIENNGVIAPKVKFPARFGKMGLVGISCTETIGNPHRFQTLLSDCLEPCEAFIYVPTKIIIQSDKVKSSEIGFILGKIHEQHEFISCIEEFEHEIYQHLKDDQLAILSIFLLYERCKGKNSFWYPYFNIIK